MIVNHPLPILSAHLASVSFLSLHTSSALLVQQPPPLQLLPSGADFLHLSISTTLHLSSNIVWKQLSPLATILASPPKLCYSLLFNSPWYWTLQKFLAPCCTREAISRAKWNFLAKIYYALKKCRVGSIKTFCKFQSISGNCFALNQKWKNFWTVTLNCFDFIRMNHSNFSG